MSLEIDVVKFKDVFKVLKLFHNGKANSLDDILKRRHPKCYGEIGKRREFYKAICMLLSFGFISCDTTNRTLKTRIDYFIKEIQSLMDDELLAHHGCKSRKNTKNEAILYKITGNGFFYLQQTGIQHVIPENMVIGLKQTA